MLCFMTLVKYEASIKLLTTTPVYELLQSTLTISTCQKKKQKKNRSTKTEAISTVKVGTHWATICSNTSQRQITPCVHVRRRVAATRWGDTSQRQIALCQYWRIFAKNIFVSATEFCCCNKSQKIKSDWICATCCGDKILLQQQIFTKFSSTHEAIYRCNVSPRHVAATCRLVCTDLQW